MKVSEKGSGSQFVRIRDLGSQAAWDAYGALPRACGATGEALFVDQVSTERSGAEALRAESGCWNQALHRGGVGVVDG